MDSRESQDHVAEASCLRLIELLPCYFFGDVLMEMMEQIYYYILRWSVLQVSLVLGHLFNQNLPQSYFYWAISEN